MALRPVKPFYVNVEGLGELLMDYRDLLVKYMRYVGQCEGTHFVDGYRGYALDQKFTPEEWECLSKCSEEACCEEDHDG